ncbi:MAG: FAD-dependent oxidoreductase [Lachnospiraceae bacterium]|nr:FAD-dependent oxidoreductase [Lachnospiraceae bacterium]
MLEISQIKLPCARGGAPGSSRAEKTALIEKKIRKELRLRDEHFTWRIIRHAVDARKKPELFDTYSVTVDLGSRPREEKLAAKLKNRNVRFTSPAAYHFPEPEAGSPKLGHRPVVIGMGPAGLFCALTLAENGYRPIVLERGRRMEERIADVEHFFESGELDPSSNIQFGEGGAGTFSDGKLTTNVRDRHGRNERVTEEFIESGAPEDIAYEQLPHIGTDLLRRVIVNLREKLVRLGGEVRFSSQAVDFMIRDGCICGVKVLSGGETYELPAEAVVLAPGHSARDTVRKLLERGACISQKNFAVGLRVSHPQQMIDSCRYGTRDAAERDAMGLPAASYKLTAQMPSGRGVYSFCMCPGGYVVNASSEKGMLAVNGMSDYARDSGMANSAIVVTVGPEEYGSDHPLAGLLFQEMLEKRAFDIARGCIPVEPYPEYAEGALKRGAGDERGALGYIFNEMQPEEAEKLKYKGRCAYAPVHDILPVTLTRDIAEAMEVFDRTLPGFAGPDAYISGPETRTSSPVRIERDASFQASIRGLYPCGEGAGYAGGIMSAAIDGLRVAEMIGMSYTACEE